MEETGAFKAGIVDEDGKRRKDFNLNSTDDRKEFSTHYTPFHRLVFNIKKLMAKAPGGSSKIASYSAALYLIKEHGGLSDKNLDKIHSATGIDMLDILSEQSEWFMLKDKQLSPGVYRIKEESITTGYGSIVTAKDRIRITESNSVPCGEVFGISIYKAIHESSQQEVFVATSELIK